MRLYKDKRGATTLPFVLCHQKVTAVLLIEKPHLQINWPTGSSLMVALEIGQVV